MSQDFSPYRSPTASVSEQASIPTAQSDDILFRKVEKKQTSVSALILIAVLFGGWCLGSAKTPAEIAAVVFLFVCFLAVGIGAQIYMTLRGRRTLTLFHDSISIQRRGQDQQFHRLDTVTSIRRWKNKRSSSKTFDAFYFFQLTFNSGQTVKFETNESLPFLIETVSRRIGQDLVKKLSTEGSVDWVPGIVIHKDGVKMPVGMLPRKKLVTWDQFQAIKFVDHHAHIFLHGKKSAATKIECGHKDFFPCLELVREMVSQNAAVEQTPCNVEAVACC